MSDALNSAIPSDGDSGNEPFGDAAHPLAIYSRLLEVIQWLDIVVAPCDVVSELDEWAMDISALSVHFQEAEWQVVDVLMSEGLTFYDAIHATENIRHLGLWRRERE